MRKKLIIVLLLAIIFVIFLIWYSRPAIFSESETESRLTQILGRKPVLNPRTQSVSYISFKGKYVAFPYPQNAEIFKEAEKGGQYYDENSLETLTFSLKDPLVWVFVNVIPAPNGVNKLEEYSGIRVRELDPKSYIKQNIIVDGKNGLVFYKKSYSGSEKTALFYINGKIYTVSVQGGNQEALEEMFTKITSSLKFL